MDVRGLRAHGCAGAAAATRLSPGYKKARCRCPGRRPKAVTRDGCCALPTQRERRRRRLRVKLGAPPLLAASMADHPRIAFLASRAEPAQQALAALVDVHGQYAPEDAEVLCVLRSAEHTSELQSLMR